MTQLSSAELLKRGGTRPPQEQYSMRSLLFSGNSGKVGVGNSTMGGKFKSIYLAQGRYSTQQVCSNNPRLNKLQSVLYELNQRPEPNDEDTFKVDLYSSPKFSRNPI